MDHAAVVREAHGVEHLHQHAEVPREQVRRAIAALDLLREAWVTGAIEHPNVVPIHFVEVDAEGLPLVVMKRIEGVEWSTLACDAAAVARRFGATDLLAWNLGVLMQVLNAVRFAHHRGVIHRDLKPSNVMIGDFGEVYLLDWGIAVSLRDDGTGRFPLATDATELAGTPCYMAPEMLGRPGGPPLSERTDVYLAGAILYELLTGRVPHEGGDAISVLASVVASKFEIPPSVPAEIARICERAMHADPAQRYPSAEARLLGWRPIPEATPGRPNYLIDADLTIKGITHPVQFAAIIAPQPDCIKAHATLDIDRTAWNVTYGSGRLFEMLGMHLVNDMVTLEFFLVAV